MGIITRRMLRSGKRPPKNTPPTITVPIAAARLGYTRLAFEDDFDSFSTIDTADSGASDFKWYVKRPYGWPSMAANEYSVANSILKITQANAYANWGLCTVHAGTKAGYSMKFGYAEASIRFDPSAAVMSDGWPAFWAKSSMDLRGTYGTRNAELDIFEA